MRERLSESRRSVSLLERECNGTLVEVLADINGCIFLVIFNLHLFQVLVGDSLERVVWPCLKNYHKKMIKYLYCPFKNIVSAQLSPGTILLLVIK